MKNKKIIIIISIVVLVLAAGAAAFFFLKKEDTKTNSQPSRPNTVDYGPPKPTDKLQPSAKDEIIDGTDSQDPDANLTITQSTQQDSTVYIRTIINGFSGGSCELTITKGTLVVAKTAPIGIQASYAVCQGFNIPVAEFAESGTWNVSITATNSEGKQVKAQKSLEVSR